MFGISGRIEVWRTNTLGHVQDVTFGKTQPKRKERFTFVRVAIGFKTLRFLPKSFGVHLSHILFSFPVLDLCSFSLIS